LVKSPSGEQFGADYWYRPSQAIFVPREASEDVVIQGTKIPKGTTLDIYLAVIQHNPAIWGDDCDDFDPDRWDHLEGEAADPHSFAAFSMGPRMCIGRVMTIIEFKVILIELLAKFEFEAVGLGGEPELMNPSPLLRPKDGMKVRLKRLSGSGI
jgi:cytochrome P450